MGVSGEAFSFNLSLIAITFAAIAALMMLIRQNMGGRLSNFDVHVTTTYLTYSLTIAMCAVLPPLLSTLGLHERAIWWLGSVLAAIPLAGILVWVPRRQRKASGVAMLPMTMIALAGGWFCVLLLIVNAAGVLLHAAAPFGAGIFLLALTFRLALLMWAFVRRVASMLGEAAASH